MRLARARRSQSSRASSGGEQVWALEQRREHGAATGCASRRRRRGRTRVARRWRSRRSGPARRRARRGRRRSARRCRGRRLLDVVRRRWPSTRSATCRHARLRPSELAERTLGQAGAGGFVVVTRRVVDRVVEERRGDDGVEVVDRMVGGESVSTWRTTQRDVAHVVVVPAGLAVARRARRRTSSSRDVGRRRGAAATPLAARARPPLTAPVCQSRRRGDPDRRSALVVPGAALVPPRQRRVARRAAPIRRRPRHPAATASRATTTTFPRSYRPALIAGGAEVVPSRELLRRLRGAGLRLTPAQRRSVHQRGGSPRRSRGHVIVAADHEPLEQLDPGLLGDVAHLQPAVDVGGARVGLVADGRGGRWRR